jgi:hypothetical protein
VNQPTSSERRLPEKRTNKLDITLIIPSQSVERPPTVAIASFRRQNHRVLIDGKVAFCDIVVFKSVVNSWDNPKMVVWGQQKVVKN